MNILLVGEYSRLHNSLKEGLIANSHNVTLVGNGDLFKQYPADIDLKPKISDHLLLRFIRKVVHYFTKFDLSDFEVVYRFKKALPNLKEFDVVQLINEDALNIHPRLQIKLLKKLFNQNKSVFLLCCGDDYISINHYLKDEQKYSILTPYLKDISLKNHYRYALKYTSKPYKKLHDFLYKHVKGVISTDLDYHITQKDRSEYLGLIPNPVNLDTIPFNDLNLDSKITIFHGVNKLSHIRKGNHYFNKALDFVQQKYSDKIKIKEVNSLPYSEYIESYNDAHIVLDAVYGFDQGYNALEAMAKGKVVLTGAEDIWLNYYHLEKDTIAINAEPDAQAIAIKLEWLVLNPEKILEISKNARAFIEREHDYRKIALKYLDVWQNKMQH